MTHWMRSVVRRIKDRSVPTAPATVRGGPSRKMSGVSTVEYALILVAVIAIVAVGGATLGEDLTTLFDNIGTDIADAKGGLETPEDGTD